MARTSKRVQAAAPVKREKVYSAGIYARLSVEGTDRKNESIENQIGICREYIQAHGDMELFDCYSDLGSTGTNFRRDDFERLMADVRMRKVDCIVVKDLSRFGRDYIEAGDSQFVVKDADGKIRGVLDIDSPLKARFTETDQEGLEKLCGRLSGKICWEASGPDLFP